MRLDLADLDTVERAAAELRDVCSRVDAVINNAGVMQTPQLKTKQGYELQLGTNHLGHFRLNSLLMPRLEADGARIVAVSSVCPSLGDNSARRPELGKGRFSAGARGGRPGRQARGLLRTDADDATQACGPVGESFVDPNAKDEAVAKGLWEQTERLVGNFFAD